MNCDKKVTNGDINGFVYLVQPVNLIGTNRFKIGCSEKLNLSRLEAYLNDVVIICVFGVQSPRDVEKNIKNVFNVKYKLCAGKEWYEGDKTAMTLSFLDYIRPRRRKTQFFNF